MASKDIVSEREVKKAERLLTASDRRAASAARLQASVDRQMDSDRAVYGKGTALMEAQSSSGGSAKGGIYDVSTDNYKQQPNNETGQNSSINDGNGIDSIGAGDEPDGGGGGLPDGYVETAVIICVNGSPVSGQFLFKEDQT